MAAETLVSISPHSTLKYFSLEPSSRSHPLTFVVGSAWLVLHKEEQKKYVAKKVILEGLGAKEQSGCMMEAGLLKNLDHPNIVAYKESFLGN